MIPHPYQGLSGQFYADTGVIVGFVLHVALDPQGTAHVTILCKEGQHYTDVLSQFVLHDPVAAARRLGATLMESGRNVSPLMPHVHTWVWSPAAAPAAPERPVAPETPRYTPTDGQAPGRADTREDHFATAEDRGQHDTHKRWAYQTLYRFAHPEHPVVPSDFATGTAVVAIPLRPIFPLEFDAAEACRRLGFRRVFLAAAGYSLADLEGSDRLTPACEAERLIHDCYQACVAATEVEVEAVLERRNVTRARVDPAIAAVLVESPRAEIAALYDPGPWSRPDLADAPPLTPLSLLSTTPRL